MDENVNILLIQHKHNHNHKYLFFIKALVWFYAISGEEKPVGPLSLRDLGN